MEDKISAPEALAGVVPIPKRLRIVQFAHPRSGMSPICLFDETVFNEMALRLAENEDYLQEAKKFLESLRGDEPIVNIEAWTFICYEFLSEEVMDNDQLLKGTANWIAYLIKADPSLNSTLGESKPLAITRVVLSILTACWHSISVPACAAAFKVSDPATFFTRLFRDESVKDVAIRLAQDIDLVQEAHKFMEPLRGDRPVVDIDAWTDLSCRLDSALDQCSLELPLPRKELKEIYGNRAQTVVQARKLIAVSILYCINSDPSSKTLLGEREDEVHLIRVVITLLITFWRDEAVAEVVENLPMITNEEDEWPNPKRIQTDDDESPLVNEDYYSDSSTSSYDEPMVVCEDEPSMIEELVDDGLTTALADRASRDDKLVRVLEEFLDTLSQNSQHNALQHFHKVKEVFENHRFIRIVLQAGFWSTMRYMRIAHRDLTEFLNLKMRSDPSFEDILKYREPRDKMRSALSILVGYWSNQTFLILLVSSTGFSPFEDVEKEEETPEVLVVEEEVPVCSSLIADIWQDASIEELANQLIKIPEVVASAEELLESLRDDAPVELQNLDCYYFRQFNAVIDFWYDPVVVVELIKAFKKSIRLFDVIKKYSKGAQFLRCEERITRIKRDPLLGTILKGDRTLQMRGALSILFGYWTETDVIDVVSSIHSYQSIIPELAEVDLSVEDVEIFDYITDCRGDVEGLMNVLADKHSQDSKAYMDRLIEISGHQEREEQNAMVEPEYRGIIRVLLKNGHVIDFHMARFIPKAKPAYDNR